MFLFNQILLNRRQSNLDFVSNFVRKTFILLQDKSMGEQFNLSEQRAVIAIRVIELSLISATSISSDALHPHYYDYLF